MSLNWPRVRRGVQRVLARKAVKLEDVQARTWTVCPEARSTCAPAIYPASALDKIRTLSPFRRWPGEELLIKGGELVLAPTTGHLLRDVDIVAGHFYCGGLDWLAGSVAAPWRLPPLKREPPLARAMLETSGSGAAFFGCLLLDDFPMALMAENPADTIAMMSNPSGHEAQYRELMGLLPRRVIQQGHVQEMTMFIDPAYNASKTARYRQLRTNLRQRVGESACTGRVYISRGLAGARRVLSNEAELEGILRQRGFTVIDPMKTSALEVARHSLDARLVVSIEGSQVSHAIFSMADDAALVLLQPPDRFGMQYKEFTDAMGMRFGFVVCDPVDDGFKVDIDELLRLLDSIET